MRSSPSSGTVLLNAVGTNVEEMGLTELPLLDRWRQHLIAELERKRTGTRRPPSVIDPSSWP